MNTLVLMLVGLMLGGGGMFLLVRPERLQQYAVRYYSKLQWAKLRSFASSRQYVWVVRLSGFVAILMAAAIFFGLLFPVAR